MFDDFDSTQESLESKGYMGGGYTWYGIVESMIRMQHSHFASDIAYDPEGSLFCARSSNLDAIRCIADCIRKATTDAQILDQAIANADESIIE